MLYTLHQSLKASIGKSTIVTAILHIFCFVEIKLARSRRRSEPKGIAEEAQVLWTRNGVSSEPNEINAITG
jgi:hypothetical protein